MSNDVQLTVKASKSPEVEMKIKTSINVFFFYITFFITLILLNKNTIYNVFIMDRNIDYLELFPNILYALCLALLFHTIIPLFVKYIPSNVEKDYQKSMDYHTHFRNSAYKEIENFITLYNKFSHKDNETLPQDPDIMNNIKAVIIQCKARADLHQKKVEDIVNKRDKLYSTKTFGYFLRSNTMQL